MNDHQEQFQRFLDAGGFHATRQRLSAAALIFSVRGHHTLDELYDILRKDMPLARRSRGLVQSDHFFPAQRTATALR
jgi:Fe2+ or Zn2+ uptake regulation protein